MITRDSGGGPAAPTEKSLIEQLAGRCVAFSLGPQFEFRHTGDASDMVDGYLVDEGRVVIAVEVTVAANAVLREFNAAIEDDPDGLRLPLRPGSGRWIALLDPSVRLKDQRTEEWQEVIDLLVRMGVTSFARSWHPNAHRLNELTVRLGIESMSRSGVDRDEIHRSSAPQGSFFINTSLDALAWEAAELLDETRMATKIARLIDRANGLEAHFVIVSGEGLSTGSRFALASIGNGDFPPSTRLELPEGLARVWFIQPGGLALAFSATQGWLRFDLRGMRLC